jgi:hypothetical protein
VKTVMHMNSQIDAGSARPLVRPIWRDEFWHDLPALEQYSAEMRVWQWQSDDPFERADAALWSRLSAPEACWVFNRTIEFLDLLHVSGDLERARAAENEDRGRAGQPLYSERDYRTRLGREYAQRVIFIFSSAEDA